QVSFDWKHEFKDDQRALAVSFVGDTRATRFTYLDEAPERNFYIVNAGVSAVLPHGIQAFVNYRALVGHSFLEGHAGTIGMRVEF
ncbi:MAG: autotransporter domain-containing protein, partial [Nitrososphaera sp.]